jgi:hypothetical protein
MSLFLEHPITYTPVTEIEIEEWRKPDLLVAAFLGPAAIPLLIKAFYGQYLGLVGDEPEHSEESTLRNEPKLEEPASCGGDKENAPAPAAAAPAPDLSCPYNSAATADSGSDADADSGSDPDVDATPLPRRAHPVPRCSCSCNNNNDDKEEDHVDEDEDDHDSSNSTTPRPTLLTLSPGPPSARSSSSRSSPFRKPSAPSNATSCTTSGPCDDQTQRTTLPAEKSIEQPPMSAGGLPTRTTIRKRSADDPGDCDMMTRK